jgi:hypothetical protein
MLFSNWMQITDVVKFLVAFSFAGRAFIKSRPSLSLAASLRRPNVRTRVAQSYKPVLMTFVFQVQLNDRWSYFVIM